MGLQRSQELEPTMATRKLHCVLRRDSICYKRDMQPKYLQILSNCSGKSSCWWIAVISCVFTEDSVPARRCALCNVLRQADRQ